MAPHRALDAHRAVALATPYLFLFPAIAVLAIAVFYPAVQAVYLSLTQYGYDLTEPPVWVGLDNFRQLAGDRLFWKTLGQTFLYLLIVVPILTVVPLGLAILVNQRLAGVRWFRAAYYVPVVVSLVVAGIAWNWLYSENGLLNQGLQLLGLGPVPWLTSPRLALFSVMAVTVWKGLGYYMTIYLAGLQGIPKELYEAAAIDGSDGWRRHWDITIPLMRPYGVLVATISAISATKVFEEVYVMTQGGPRSSSKTVVYYLYERAFEDLELNYACTVGLVLFLLVLALSGVRLFFGRSPGAVGLE